MSDLLVRGGFGIREGLLEKAGDATITHEHRFHHMTYLLGPARVEKLAPTNPEKTQFRVLRTVDKPRGGYVFIEAGVFHRLTALADNVAYHCLYVHRTPDGQISDEFDGWQQAYA